MSHDYRATADALSRLTPAQYRVTQDDGTEPPFRNEYWNHHEPGIYVDVVSASCCSRRPTSTTAARAGRASPADRARARREGGRMLWMKRTEVRSSGADSHLGHVFDDGPRDAGACATAATSAASPRFIPVAQLEEQGYGVYRSLFDTTTTQENAS